MKEINIIGAGGPAGIGLARCLMNRGYEVTGQDDSVWAELMLECGVSGGRDADMVIALPDSQILRNNFRCPEKQIDLCHDKAKTARILGDLAPKTYWVRDTHGAGGAGAQMQSEFLPGDNYSVEFVIWNNKRLATFAKKRVSYSVKSKTQGVDNRGSSAVSVCVSNSEHEEYVNSARAALHRIRMATGTDLHGFYGVDLKCDENGVPKVTEINAGRLLTASYAFFSHTGYNLPLVGVKAFFGEELPTLPDYPLGVGQIRQVGQLPQFFGPELTKRW